MFRALFLLGVFRLARASTLQCLKDSCSTAYKACSVLPACKTEVLGCMEKCADDSCETECMEKAAKNWQVGPDLVALYSLDMCGGWNSCFTYSAEMAAAKLSSEPCCNKECKPPLVKYFSTDAAHGFCGEACMDPAKFSTYHRFEANLTRATGEHPCSEQLTPSNTKKYTDYFSTVTHGFPHVLTVTLDLYAPTGMPDHSCCVVPLFTSLNCFGIPGKPRSMEIFGTGPYCCPGSATESDPCTSESMANVVV